MSVARSGSALMLPVGEHQHGQGLVALIGLGFRLEHFLVHGERPAGEIAVEGEDFLPDLVTASALDHTGGGDGTRVDHGVHLGAFVLLDGHDRVEHLARRIDAHVVHDGVHSRLLHHQGHGEHLGDRLDGNFRLDVAFRVDLAVHGDQGDAVDVGIDLGQGRNVIGILAFLQILVLGVGRIQGRLDRRRSLGLGHGRAQKANGQGQDSQSEPVIGICFFRCISCDVPPRSFFYRKRL